MTHVAFALLMLAAAAARAAQPAVTYPDKPVRMIVPFVAGASYDTVARIVAQPLSEAWQQQILQYFQGFSKMSLS